MDTLDIIRDILQENQGIDPASVTPESTFDDLQIDSLDAVELVCELEDRLQIEIDDIEGLANLGELVEHLDSLRD